MVSNMTKEYSNIKQKAGSSIYSNTYTSFAGTDIVATFTPRGGKPVVLGEIQTISYSTYRPTTPVYVLGRPNAKGIVRGQRTIAGSLIFTVFDRHVLHTMKNSLGDTISEGDTKYCKNNVESLKTDELPPFDISISFMNEYGQSSKMTLYDVYILSEGQTMSIEDIMTENTMQFLAMDIEHMQPDVYEGEETK